MSFTCPQAMIVTTTLLPSGSCLKTQMLLKTQILVRSKDLVVEPLSLER